MNDEELIAEVLAAAKTGDLDTAAALALSAADRRSDNLALLYECGSLLWESYHFSEAEAIFTRLLQDERATIAQCKSIAKRYFGAGRFAASAATLQAAIHRGDEDVELLELYAGALERDHQVEAAAEQAERALARRPGSARAVRLLAHIDARSGRYESAVERLRRCLFDFPSSDDWRLRYELASALDRLQDFSAAWGELVLAKQQLAEATRERLRESYLVRRRQWEAAAAITDADLARWRRDAAGLDEPPHQLILLAGFPRSGTTLLEQLLAGREDCIGTDETGVVAAQFTADLIWRAPTLADAIVEVRGFGLDQLRAGRREYLRCTEAFLGEPVGDRRLIEKEPLLTADFLVPLRLFPEASLIMPLRDPRDVLVSYFFTMVPLNWSSAPATTIVESAKFYSDVLRHWILLRGRVPWTTCELRYEDLAADPSETIRRLTDRLDLARDESMLDDARRSERRAVRTPTYVDVARPISTRAVGRWKNYAQELEPALGILAPFISEFGYE